MEVVLVAPDTAAQFGASARDEGVLDPERAQN
jgi:hypothetical protein